MNGNVGMSGTVTIENCKVAMDVKTDRTTDYGTCGGIVGFINKTYACTTLNVNISNCEFTGKLTGKICGGIVANYSPSNTAGAVSLTITNCTANATHQSTAASGVFGTLVGRADFKANLSVSLKIDNGTAITTKAGAAELVTAGKLGVANQ